MSTGLIASLYSKIGPVGVALVFLSLASTYLALKNIALMSLINRDFRRQFALIESDSEFCADKLYKSNNPIIGIIAEILRTHAHSSDIRAEVAYLFHRNFVRIMRDITWLKLISVIAPLLGLLGTMFGMTTIFRELAAGTGGASASMLADGIWVALLTTIMGMVIAIPTLVAFYWLSLKIKDFHMEAIEHSYRAVERFRYADSHDISMPQK
ncbi:MAG: MotA/TolQ/ExbB proton channel family protein [Holophagales bacterium]|jgi:biopolymer transport protein ExbB|nr:MotA/TolQ/ExbB proton channel family protein [Holophagales bacterium]